MHDSLSLPRLRCRCCESHTNNGGCEWAGRARMALAAGVKLETLDVIAGLMPLDALSKDDACMEVCGRELFRDRRISDAT